MIHIVTCNVLKDYNLGSPSIIYGIDYLMQHLFGEEYEILNFEKILINNMNEKNIPARTIYYNGISKKNIFGGFFGGRYGIGLPKLLIEINKADVVIDLFGICYCDDFYHDDFPRWKYPLINFSGSMIAWLAKKILHKKVIKNAASYGPIRTEYNKYAATYFANEIYDVMVAREKESRRALGNLGTIKKEVLYSPDIANLMPYDKDIVPDDNKICISVSHQIKRQWAATEEYVACIVKLCKHILKNGKSVVLVPNECQPGVYNDTSVALEIQAELMEYNISLSILPVETMTAVEIKNEIASSGALIASRYHSCVAGLSAGVPTLVIGWHYKYDELLESYGQSKWILSNHDCDSQKLIDIYERFMASREENLAVIAKQKEIVRAKVLEVGREMMERAGVL